MTTSFVDGHDRPEGVGNTHSVLRMAIYKNRAIIIFEPHMSSPFFPASGQSHGNGGDAKIHRVEARTHVFMPLS
jgi:hypothetical protein